ncbi:MAG: dihydrolipoyl dehydrogenase [Euzebyales bacterium]|nr:dihydrolipoyl dehydrogenase [Euzebyales bacterium]
MADTYDVVILGGGTGGYSCALRAADLGLSVALVEKEKVGGTCLHWGCIPTKAFLQAAEVAEHAQTATEYGVKASFDGIDMERVLSYKAKVVAANYKGLQASLKGRGVDVIAGSGRLKDARSLVVSTGEGERTLAAGKAMVLATGSKPRGLPVDGAEIDGERVITSDHALYLEKVPQRPVVLGASAVGVEFASVWKAYGAEEVTLVEALDGVVPREDVDTQKTLAKDLKRSGMKVHVGAKVTGVDKGGDGVRVALEDGTTLEGDLLMVAVGRGPVSEDMGFEDAGVTLDRGFVTVDDLCRTGPEGLYAVGDVIPTLGLAHASFQEGFLVAEHVAGRKVRPIDYAGIPRVYYCHPEIGSVGYSEQELGDQGVEFDKQLFPYSHNARAMMMKGSGHVKVLAAKSTPDRPGKVLGIHIVGPHATDLIAEGQLIYNWEALPTDVAAFIHPHPTLSEAIGEAHLALAGKPLHG